MASPLRKPRIEYKPQIGDAVQAPPVPHGEEGARQTAADIASLVDMLINEVTEAVFAVESALAEFAIADGKGLLTGAVSNVLDSEDVPTAISYDTYNSLRGKPGTSLIRRVFEDKAYSVWGNASIALIDALSLIAGEAIKVKTFLQDGVTDPDTVEALEKWVGSARSFVVDAKAVGTAKADERIHAEIDSYTDKAVDVQKSAIIGANSSAMSVRSDLGRLRGLYGSGNVYDSVIDTSPVVEPMTDGVVGALIRHHADIANGTKHSLINDLRYRSQAFSEVADSLISSVSQLRATQIVNRELAESGGIAEVDMDDVVTTTPDRTYDKVVLSAVRAKEGIPADEPITLARVVKQVNESIEIVRVTEIHDIISSPGDWHTKSLHDDMDIDAGTLDGHSSEYFAASSHSHDYAPSNHVHSAGDKTVLVKVIDDATPLETGNGKASFVVPSSLAGLHLKSANAHVFTQSSSNQVSIMIRCNLTDLLNPAITIDVNESDSKTAATQSGPIGAITLQEGSVIYIDVDSAGTGTAGLEVRLVFG